MSRREQPHLGPVIRVKQRQTTTIASRHRAAQQLQSGNGGELSVIELRDDKQTAPLRQGAEDGLSRAGARAEVEQRPIAGHCVGGEERKR